MTEVLDLVLAPNASAFARAARPLLDRPADLEALLPALLRETALRHWREEYPKHIPHALLALLGGLEARALLPDAGEGVRPALQALFYVSEEKHYPRFAPDSVPARGDADTLARGLAAGDFPAAYGAVRALAAGGRLGEVRDTLLSDATGDCFNLFHRFIFPAKVFRCLEGHPAADAAALLYPVVHYACVAPRDARYREEMGDPDPRDPEGRAERAFARAVRRLPGLADYEWVPLAHAANFAEAAAWWCRRTTHPDRIRGPWLAERFVADLAGERPPAPAPTPDEDGGSAARLEAAIDRRDPAAAGAAAAALLGGAGPRSELERGLLLGCSRIDGGIAFSHDVKVAANAIRLARRAADSELPGVLVTVAQFLANLPAGDRLAAALFPPLPS